MWVEVVDVGAGGNGGLKFYGVLVSGGRGTVWGTIRTPAGI